MKFFSGLLLCALFAMISGEDKVKVTILYESLCPDSVKFIQNELAPSYEHVKDYVDILFVPFGNSNSSDGGAKFECQHGDEECVENLMHSCVLSQLKSQDDKVKFITCQMVDMEKVEKTGKDCVKMVESPFEPIEECISSGAGKELQLAAEILTKSYKPTFIPTIIYDSVFEQTKQDRSKSEFLLVVCEQLKAKGLFENNPKLQKCVELCA